MSELGYPQQTKHYPKCWKCGKKWKVVNEEKIIRSGMLCKDAHERGLAGALPLWHLSCFESTPVNVVSPAYGKEHPEEFEY